MPDSAILVQVADAITAELAAAQVAGDFVGLEPFTPERSYADWESDLAALDGLRVDVVPTSYAETELADRDTVAYLCTTRIGVRRWFDRDKTENVTGRLKRGDIDRLVLFVQELHEFFLSRGEGRRLATLADAVWQETKILSTYSRKHLREPRMFLGLVQVAYSVQKPLS